MAQCFKFAKEGTIIKLPEPNDKGKIPSMKFTNFKNKLERPYIVYDDMESTLVKTDHKKNIHEHVPNSCCFYFVCTYDSCLLYTSPSPRDRTRSRMPSSA